MELPVCGQCGERHVGRGGYIGSGDAAAIIGVSDPEYHTAVKCYQAKVDPKPEDELSGPNGVQDRGLVLEPVIIDRFARRRGLEVVDRQLFRTIPGVPFPIGSHIDGRVTADGALVEAKSTAMGLRDNWGEAESADIPDTYLSQCAHHMAVHPEAPGVWVPVMFVGFVLREEWFYVPRDAQFVKDVIDAEVAFAEKHIIPRVPPPAVTAADVKRLYPRALGTAVEATTEIALAVTDLADLRGRLKALKDEEEKVAGKVAAALGPHERLDFGGKTIATFKTQERAAYTVAAGSTRVLRLKK